MDRRQPRGAIADGGTIVLMEDEKACHCHKTEVLSARNGREQRRSVAVPNRILTPIGETEDGKAKLRCSLCDGIVIQQSPPPISAG
jgi:hypothetical protein